MVLRKTFIDPITDPIGKHISREAIVPPITISMEGTSIKGPSPTPIIIEAKISPIAKAMPMTVAISIYNLSLIIIFF